MATELQEPKGIGFYDLKTGDTHYCKLEPTIQAYINSSDMGINASRGQDFKWRLEAAWVKRVKAFKRNQTQMAILTAKNGGQKPTTTQILYYMYGEELAAYMDEAEENETPFEAQYQQDISETPKKKVAAKKPKALEDFQADEDDDIADLIDSEVMESEEEGKQDADKDKSDDSSESPTTSSDSESATPSSNTAQGSGKKATGRNTASKQTQK